MIKLRKDKTYVRSSVGVLEYGREYSPKAIKGLLKSYVGKPITDGTGGPRIGKIIDAFLVKHTVIALMEINKSFHHPDERYPFGFMAVVERRRTTGKRGRGA